MKTLKPKELLEKSNIYFDNQLKEICSRTKRNLDHIVENGLYYEEDEFNKYNPMEIEIHEGAFDLEIEEIFDLIQGIESQCDDTSNLFENLRNENQIEIDRISKEFLCVRDIFSRIHERRYP